MCAGGVGGVSEAECCGRVFVFQLQERAWGVEVGWLALMDVMH